MKVLFISPYPTEGPSYRYRVEQYFPYLKSNGIECYSRSFISSKFYKIVYKPKNILKKCAYFLVASISRCFDFFMAFRYDIIFIHLETYPIGPPVFEYLWSKLGKSIVYDLDDAIYLADKRTSYKIIKFLKYHKKISTIIRLSSEIIVCNNHLKNYVSKFKSESKINIIPTSIDTNKFLPRQSNNKNTQEVTIGWIGSHSTVPYLNQLKNVFKCLNNKYNFTLKIVGSNELYKIGGVKIINKEWSLSTELEDFQSLDIGIYPLPDNEWIKGKTGFKTIQYMAIGIPCVVSNVGTNKEIVQEGINGFLADTDKEWVEKLSLLIKNLQLRQKMGLAGRKTIEEKYSVKVNAPKFLEVIQKAYGKSKEI